jgi:hypothetical protein
MIANNSDGERSWRFAEVATASAIRPHCDGVQAGVCQRIFSFTAQTVCARQALACTSPPGSVSGSGVDWTTASGGEAACAKEGAKLARAVAVPKDKDSFRKSANTASPLSLKTVPTLGRRSGYWGRRGLTAVWTQRFDPLTRQGKSLVEKNVVPVRRKT